MKRNFILEEQIKTYVDPHPGLMRRQIARSLQKAGVQLGHQKSEPGRGTYHSEGTTGADNSGRTEARIPCAGKRDTFRSIAINSPSKCTISLNRSDRIIDHIGRLPERHAGYHYSGKGPG